MPNALTYWAIRARHLPPHVIEHWLWRYRYFFKVKLTFEMLAVHGQQHSFSTHERVFLWKSQSFWDRKCLDLRGTWTPNLRIHAECSNLLSYQGQTFAALCRYIYQLRRCIFRYIHCSSKLTLWGSIVDLCHKLIVEILRWIMENNKWHKTILSPQM